MSKTIAFSKFKNNLTSEIRLYWHILASLKYSERWWGTVSPVPDRLSCYPGDDVNPFKSADIPVSDYLSNIPNVISCIRENAIISFVTAFEFYLFEVMERIIYLDPSKVDDSKMPFEASELAKAIPSTDIKKWFANKITEKYLRNKTHLEMITKIDKMAKAGVSKSLEVDINEWNKWTLVRNAIVHTARFATADLVSAWPSKYSTPGEKFNFADRDVVQVHKLALKIATAIDQRAIHSVINKCDSKLIVKELFIQKGISDPRAIRSCLNQVLSSRLNTSEIEQVISWQRKGLIIDAYPISSGVLDALLA